MTEERKVTILFAATVLAAKKVSQRPFVFSDRVIAVRLCLCQRYPSAREQK
jgi:hypothetical protein